MNKSIYFNNIVMEMASSYNFIINSNLINQLLTFVNIKTNGTLKHLDKENITLNLDPNFLLHIEQFTSVKKNIYLNKSVKNFYCEGNICIIDYNIIISEEWLHKYFDLFNYAVKQVIPRLTNNNSKLERIFYFTLFTKITNIKSIILTHEFNKYIAVASKDRDDIFIKTLYSKLAHQTNQNEYDEWFSNGNFYQYSNSILLLNINLTTGLLNNNYYSHLKFWRTFITKLLVEIIQSSTNKINIYCIGNYAKLLINKLNNDFKLNCNIYNDVDPRLKNKPHDYLSMPPFFSDNSLLFLN
jgi:hypothetical protein